MAHTPTLFASHIRLCSARTYGPLLESSLSPLNEMQRQTSTNGVLLDDIRQVIREELQEVSFAAAPPVFEQVQPELTEEQQAENEKSVLDDLEMFG